MRRITANIIYPVSSAPIKNAFIELDDDNRIIGIIPYKRGHNEPHHLEYYSGVLVPGFVNAHCHLELSHLKSKINADKGLINFVKQVQQLRLSSMNEIEDAALNAIKFMYSRGINAVGDIVNNALALKVKKETDIRFYNFVELFNESGKSIESIIEHGIDTINNFKNDSSVVPHSMYGTNRELLKCINAINNTDQINTLHFLESNWEAKVDANRIVSYLMQISNAKKLLLVHNLFLNNDILNKIKAEKTLYEKIYWVTCPKSTKYISGNYPPINKFRKWDLKLCLGTDSLASNNVLSIFDEMICLFDANKDILFEEVLKWATINGAEALGMESVLGSFELGKKPGVNLIEKFDFKNSRLSNTSEIKRLV